MFIGCKRFPIAAILAATFFCSFVNHGGAIEITSVSPGSYETSCFPPTQYILTDKPIYSVSWSVNGTIVDGETFALDNAPTCAYFYPTWSDYPGDGIKGKKYTVTVEVWEWDDDAEVFRSDTESYDIIITAPIIDSGIKKKEKDGGEAGKVSVTGAFGYAEVTRHYFDGSSFVMKASARAFNRTDETLRVEAWFRQREYTVKDDGEAGGAKDEKRDTKPPEDVAAGKLSKTYSPDSMIVNFPLGRLIADDQFYYFDAHTHLRVSTIEQPLVVDDWEADTGVQLFDKEDNP